MPERAFDLAGGSLSEGSVNLDGTLQTAAKTTPGRKPFGVVTDP
jgi:hypothetical protein